MQMSLKRSAGRWAWLPVLLLVFAPTMLWLWHRWTMSIWHHGHGIFIPLVVGYLVYDALSRDKILDEDSSAWGYLFLVPALLLVVVDTAINTELMSAFALALSLPGLSLLLLGVRRTRILAFPLLIAFFMLPIPSAFISRFMLLLRRIAAWGCEHLVNWLGLPILRNDTSLYMPTSSLEIADACSGFSTLYAALTMALILAYFSSSVARRAVLLAAAAPLAIACNIVRCAALAFLVEYRGPGVLDTTLHPMTGMISFGGALGILFLLATVRIPKGASK